jgi:hypothetical protein
LCGCWCWRAGAVDATSPTGPRTLGGPGHEAHQGEVAMGTLAKIVGTLLLVGFMLH